MPLRLSPVILSAAFVMLSDAALAAGAGGSLRQACKADAQSLCSDVQPGGGRILKCLNEHSKDLSDDCASALQTLKSRHAASGKGPEQNGNDSGSDN